MTLKMADLINDMKSA